MKTEKIKKILEELSYGDLLETCMNEAGAKECLEELLELRGIQEQLESTNKLMCAEMQDNERLRKSLEKIKKTSKKRLTS